MSGIVRTESELLVLDDGREQRVVRQLVDCSKLRGETVAPFLACEPGVVYMQHMEHSTPAWLKRPLDATWTVLRAEMLTGEGRLAGLVGSRNAVPDGMQFRAAAIRMIEHEMVGEMLDELAAKLESVAAL